MLGAAAAVLSLLCAQAPNQANEANEAIVLGEKKTINFLLITPTGNVASTSSSELIRLVSSLLTEHTDLAPAIIDPAQVAECKGRIACIVSKTRGDARLLLVLSNLTGSGTADRLSVLLVDIEAAQRIVDETPRDVEDFEIELEARINDGAVLARPKWAALANEKETRAFLDRLFTGELKSAFENTHDWEPYGAIELLVDLPGAAIELDGAAIGTMKNGPLKILHVSPGKRALKIVHPTYEPYSTEAIVERGKTLSITPELVAERGIGPALRTGMFWSGVGLAVTGAVITAIAVARQDSSLATYCAANDTTCTTHRTFQSADFSPDSAPTFEDKVNPSGVLFAPLGYSLIAVGGTWTLLAQIFDGDARGPWIELGAGLAAGVLAYGISAALNQGSGF